MEFCNLAVQYPVSVRFLEFMPLCGESWTPKRMLPIPTIKRWVSELHPLEPLPRGHHAAETFAIPGAPGTIGFIASLSEPFCESCNRLRLTASGELRLCLFSPIQFDLRSHLRHGESDEEIMALIRSAIRQKPKKRQALPEDSRGQEFPRIRVIGG
jgi:cyclic pyranopterin phosphate synthase